MHKGNILPNCSFGSVARMIDTIGQDFRTALYINYGYILQFKLSAFHARSLCRRVSMTVMHVKLMYGAVRKSLSSSSSISFSLFTLGNSIYIVYRNIRIK